MGQHLAEVAAGEADGQLLRQDSVSGSDFVGPGLDEGAAGIDSSTQVAAPTW